MYDTWRFNVHSWLEADVFIYILCCLFGRWKVSLSVRKWQSNVLLLTILTVTVDLFLYVGVNVCLWSVMAVIYNHLYSLKLGVAFQHDSVLDIRGLKAPTSDNLGVRPGRIIRSVVTSLTQVQALCHSFFLPSHSQPWQGVRGNTLPLRLGTGESGGISLDDVGVF